MYLNTPAGSTNRIFRGNCDTDLWYHRHFLKTVKCRSRNRKATFLFRYLTLHNVPMHVDFFEFSVFLYRYTNRLLKVSPLTPNTSHHMSTCNMLSLISSHATSRGTTFYQLESPLIFLSKAAPLPSHQVEAALSEPQLMICPQFSLSS